jgi:hypothetical protein
VRVIWMPVFSPCWSAPRNSLLKVVLTAHVPPVTTQHEVTLSGRYSGRSNEHEPSTHRSVVNRSEATAQSFRPSQPGLRLRATNERRKSPIDVVVPAALP